MIKYVKPEWQGPYDVPGDGGGKTLIPWANFAKPESLLLVVKNVGSVQLTCYLDTSEDGASLDDEFQVVKQVQPGKQCSFPISATDLRTFYRLYIDTDEGADPGQVQWIGYARFRNDPDRYGLLVV